MKNKRLSKRYNKYGKPYCFNCKEEVRYDNDIVRQALYKLGKLEDLEEQTGCPLDVYVRATIGGIWYSIAGVMKQCYVDTINGSKIIFAMKGTNIWFELSNYKKTWWLKEDKEE